VVWQLRGRALPHNLRYHVEYAIHDSLAAHLDSRAIATCILHVDEDVGRFNPPWRLLEPLSRLDGDRFLPYVHRLLDAGLSARPFVDAALKIGAGKREVARLRALASYPEEFVRRDAARALQSLGHPYRLAPPRGAARCINDPGGPVSGYAPVYLPINIVESARNRRPVCT